MLGKQPAISKAIIPVAGFGTRRLPITKAIEKCMLPICNRPIIDYSVEECIRAGIQDIFFVVSPDFEQLRSYYSNNVPLEEYLARRGKVELLDELQAIPLKANFHYVVQDSASAYGTAVPVWIARNAVSNDEHFVVLFGDNFIFHGSESTENDLLSMMEAVLANRSDGALLAMPMNDHEISLYGALKVRQGGGASRERVTLLDSIVEKPTSGTAPSNLASISYYIFNNRIMPYLEDTMRTANSHGEHFLTDAVNAYTAAGSRMIVVESSGRHLDGGNLDGWVEANRIVYDAYFKA